MPRNLPRQAELSRRFDKAIDGRGIKRLGRRVLLAALGHAFGFIAWQATAQVPGAEAAKRGAYLFEIAGCGGCHTDVKNNGKLLAGGRAIETPFGTFYGPNITPDPVHGIGKWSDQDFIRALKQGLSPAGAHYYPAFPYTSFAKASEADLKDIKAYIFTVPAVAQPSRAHDLTFPFGFRWLLAAWKWLYFAPAELRPDPAKPPEWNRGAYVVEALVHCAECHTPRNFLGARQSDLAFAGNADGPGGERVPNITPHPDTGIGKWTAGDIDSLLSDGFTPEGDVVGGAMGEVVRASSGKLTEADRKAVIAYLRGLPAINYKPPSKKK